MSHTQSISIWLGVTSGESQNFSRKITLTFSTPVSKLSIFVKNFRGFWNTSSRKFLNLTLWYFKITYRGVRSLPTQVQKPLKTNCLRNFDKLFKLLNYLTKPKKSLKNFNFARPWVLKHSPVVAKSSCKILAHTGSWYANKVWIEISRHAIILVYRGRS